MVVSQHALQVGLWKSCLDLGSSRSRRWHRIQGQLVHSGDYLRKHRWRTGSPDVVGAVRPCPGPSGRKSVSVTGRASALSPPLKLPWLRKTASPKVRPPSWHSSHPGTNHCKVQTSNPLTPTQGNYKGPIQLESCPKGQLRPLFRLHCSPTSPSATQLPSPPFYRVDPKRTL